MTTMRRLKKDLAIIRAQSREYLVRILEEVEGVSPEVANEIAPGLSSALDEARKNVRQAKTEKRLGIGSDTAIVSQEEIDRNLEEYERKQRKDEDA